MHPAFIIGAIAALIVGAIYMSGALDSALPPAVASSHLTSYSIEETEHGFKTSRVIATRYSNEAMGWNVGFQYPKNANDADRAELDDFFRANKGWVYQGGGYPGATQYVKFKNVTDKESASAKIKEILPALSQLITDLGNGVKVAKFVDPDAKVWPDTDAPDKTNPYWEINNNLNVNGTPYKKVEVEPGRWQWKVNEEAQQMMRDYERRKDELYAALRTRVLTDEELARAEGYGLSLVTRNMQPYYEREKRQELDDAFVQQTRLRAAASR